MNWKELWMTLFGTTEWLGVSKQGFWVALAAVLTQLYPLMNVLFLVYEAENRTPKTVLISIKEAGESHKFSWNLPSCIFFQFNTIYCIFIIDLLYILCYYDIVFKFCVIPL